MGACANCGQDLPDGGNVCDACSMPWSCADCGKPTEPHQRTCVVCHAYARSQEGNQIAPRLVPAELVAVYEKADSDIRQGFALVEQAMDRINAAFTLDKPSGICVQRGSEYVRFGDPESHLKEVRRAIWHTMVERLEIRRFMSVAAWEELQREIDKGEVPELTEEAILAMAKQFSDRAPAMLEQAVAEVFDFLRPPHSEYKRNSEFEVPRRVALTWVIDTWYTKTFPSKFLQPRHQCEQKLTALENVFSSLDGKGSTTKSHVSQLSEAIRKTKRGALGQTDYFAFRGFNNGALHLEFRRSDLLLRFNQIAGGSRLRAKAAE